METTQDLPFGCECLSGKRLCILLPCVTVLLLGSGGPRGRVRWPRGLVGRVPELSLNGFDSPGPPTPRLPVWLLLMPLVIRSV